MSKRATRHSGFRRTLLSVAILGTGSVPLYAQNSGAGIEEIIVTSTRRAENLQDVPIAIQVFTGDTLEKLNVKTLDDYIRYLPNVTVASKGPGQNQIYMRGLANVTVGNQVSGGVGPFPNVAVYLDDQSVQLPGRNLDVYAADLERIEILEGPQGTLFGAGAQAGVVRYITNKPMLGQFGGSFSGAYEFTENGDPSSKAEGAINIPIGDRAAVRMVLYNDDRGGYIDNVDGTFRRRADSLGMTAYFNGVLPPGQNTLSNSALTENDYNTATYKGVRVSGLYEFNDDWNVLIQTTQQQLDVDGVFDYKEDVGDFQVQQYNQSSLEDDFTDWALTVNGRLSMLEVVYTGGYLERDVDGTTDYTNYSNAQFGPYYQCVGGVWEGWGGSYYFGDSPYCYSPSAVWRDIQTNEHESHELRVSTPEDKRLRLIAGLFYEDFQIEDSANFLYGRSEAGFVGQSPLPGTTQYDSNRRPNGTAFFNDITRGYEQDAVFGEVAFDIIPDTLTVTAGLRHYTMDTYMLGSTNSAFGCRYIRDCNPAPYSKDFDAQDLQEDFEGNAPKYNITWHVSDDLMVYATYSEGFRPGGFNRGRGPGGFLPIPEGYDTDELINYEAGLKSSLLDNQLQLNAAIYYMEWNETQLTQFNPAVYGNLTFTGTGPDYEIQGMELQGIYEPIDGLTIQAAGSYNESEQVSDPYETNPATGEPYKLFDTRGLDSPTANAPEFQGNVRVRYDFDYEEYMAFWQFAVMTQTSSYAQVVLSSNPGVNEKLDGYTTVDGAVGISKDAWALELYGVNLTDELAILYRSANDQELRATPNRPRTIGLRLTYKLGEG